MARPVAVKMIPGSTNVIVTVVPLTTRIGHVDVVAAHGFARAQQPAGLAADKIGFGHDDAGTHAVGRDRLNDEIGIGDGFAALDIVYRNGNARAVERSGVGRESRARQKRQDRKEDSREEASSSALSHVVRSAAACRLPR